MDKRIFAEQSLVRELQSTTWDCQWSIRIVRFGRDSVCTCRETHLLWQAWPYLDLDFAGGSCQVLSLLRKATGQFDQRAALQEALLFARKFETWQSHVPTFTWWIKMVDATGWKRVKILCSIQWILALWADITTGIAKQEFSESAKDHSKIDFLWKPYGRRLCSLQGRTRPGHGSGRFALIQDYLIGRVPIEYELKVLDTYWPLSSHDFLRQSWNRLILGF